MKRCAIACLAALLFLSVAAWSETGDEITIYVMFESDVYFPDGTFMFHSGPMPQIESVRLTGSAAHYGSLIGDGHIINDGVGRDKGQQFMLDPWYATLRMRYRTQGTMEIIQFDETTGTMDGEATVWYEVFGFADEVLPLYPWADPRGSAKGQGWWLIAVEEQIWTAVYP